MLLMLLFFYSCLLGCVACIVWNYKLFLICGDTTFYPVQGALEVNLY